MKVIVKYFSDPEDGEGGHGPKAVSVQVLREEGNSVRSLRKQRVPKDGIQLAVGQTVELDISDVDGGEPDLDEFTVTD